MRTRSLVTLLLLTTLAGCGTGTPAGGLTLDAYPPERVARGREIIEREAASLGIRPYSAFGGQPPVLVVLLSKPTWSELSAEDRVSVTLGAEALVREARANPEPFLAGVVPGTPAHAKAVQVTRKLGDQAWEVSLVGSDGRTIESTAVAGGTSEASTMRSADR